jgi:hypothetical protein
MDGPSSLPRQQQLSAATSSLLIMAWSTGAG